ncbi:MAG: hypothetical protein RJA20_2393 [Bacteroidota bacterium]|jgi:hypothetical protein
MKKFFLVFCAFSALAFSTSAQEGPRMFLDVPAIFVVAPDFENIKTNVGLGGAFAFNVGTHWSVARVGAGVQATADPKEDLQETLNTTPFALLEVGGGMYRSNGDRCARTKRAAFTVLGKGGLRYYFQTRDLAAGNDAVYGLDYTLGAELGYFYIRDMFRNFEVVADINYHFNAERLSVTLGFKHFLNLRASRPY